MVSGEFQRRVKEIRRYRWQSKFSFLPKAVKEGDEQAFFKIIEEAIRD